MADETKSVILDVKLDIGDSAAKAAELRDTIIQLKEAQKENKRETAEQKAMYEATDASIKSHTERLALLTQGIKNQETATKSNTGSFNQLQASLKVGEAQLKQLTGTIQKNADGTFNLSKEYFEAKKQVDNAKNALLLFNAGISQGNLNVGNYDNTITGMRQKLQDLQVVLQSTEIGSTAFDELNKDLQDTSFNIQVAEGKIDSMGERVAKNKMKDGFNDAMGAAQALTGAIGILSLAMGTDTKAGETMRKVMIGVTIAQTALTIAKSKDDVVGTALAIKNKVLAASQAVYTMAVGASTGALKAFRVAMLATGIGAVIAGVALLIQRMDRLRGITDEEREAQEKLNAAFEEAQARELKFANILAERSKVMERNLALRESEGASLKELHELNVQLNNDELANIDLALKTNISLEEKNKLVDRQKDLLNQNKILDNEYSSQVLENSKKIKEEKEKEVKALTDAMNDYYNDLIDAETKARESMGMTAWEWYQKQLELEKQKAKDTVKVYDDMGEEITTTYDDSMGQILASTKKLIDDRAAALIEDQENQKEFISSFAQEVGNIFAESLTETGMDLKKFFANLSILILDSLEKTILKAQIEILATQIASKGFAGIATSAIQIGLITAAFEGVKALITQQSQAQFYEGGYTGDGDPREQSLALGKKPYIYHKKEYVVNHELLENPFVAQQVSIIESMRKNNPLNMGLIGKADGGFASNFSRSLMNQQSLSAADIAQIKMFVSVTDINNMQNSVKVTESISGL